MLGQQLWPCCLLLADCGGIIQSARHRWVMHFPTVDQSSYPPISVLINKVYLVVIDFDASTLPYPQCPTS